MHRYRYEEKIEEMREQLIETLPKICAYFGKPNFINVLAELKKYHKNVEKHYREFLETQRIWAKIMEHFVKTKKDLNETLVNI